MAYIAADDILSDFAVGSLRQLRALARQEPNIVVAAQFDANGKRDIARLVFEGSEDRSQSIHASEKAAIAADTDMAEPRSLTDFINWAYAKHPADRYCLVLWGHGPELLVADHPSLRNGRKQKRFLTPLDVKKGLAQSNLIGDKRKFDIVALDACNMSMMELACEIDDYAEFLVASEEEVPDFSFPYDRLLLLSQSTSPHEIARTCQELPRRYISAYEDYIVTQSTQTESITLSSLSLKNAGTVTELLRQLADALTATRDKPTREAIINARANAQAFVLGLYVDLYDFCDRLLSELDLAYVNDPALISACENIRSAIQLRGNDAFIVANEVSKNKRCHGVSIYFPYLTDSAKETTDAARERSVVHVREHNGSGPVEAGRIEVRTRGGSEFSSRGGTWGQHQSGGTAGTRGGLDALNKGGMEVLSKGGMDVLSKMRRQRIEETEQYYPHLKLSAETRWDTFIRHCWSRWLVEDAKEKAGREPGIETSEILNQHYSAQQCALNLLSLCQELEKHSTDNHGRGSQQSLSQERGDPVTPGIR